MGYEYRNGRGVPADIFRLFCFVFMVVRMLIILGIVYGPLKCVRMQEWKNARIYYTVDCVCVFFKKKIYIYIYIAS